MSENEQPAAEPAPPMSEAPASPENAVATPVTAPESGTPPTSSGPRGPQGRGGPGGDRKKKPGGGGPGGSGRVRMREAMPSLDSDFRFGSTKLDVGDLDKEIADEIESAMGGLSSKELLGADTSRNVRQQAQGDSSRKQGKILRIHGQDVFVDVPGGRSQGMLTMDQFPDGPPKEGDVVEFSIEGFDPENSLLILSRKGAAVHADWSNVAEGMVVEARVTATNKGGLSVDVNGIKGFMPISQIDLYRVENAEQFVNQRLLSIVTEANSHEKNLVVSRRAFLEKERAEKQEKLWAELAENQIHSGIVRNIKPFGAFVDLGGVDALLPISELSWRRIKDPTEIVQIGQTVKVAVLKLDRDTRKITVTLKQLETSPWETISDRFAIGDVVQGKVTRTAQFGAFVELEPGLEGLVPISELARQRVFRVHDFAKEGQDVTVKIINVDPEQRRLTLSMKQAIELEAPKPAEEEEDEVEVEEKPRVQRPRTTPLRGGTGSDWRSNLPSS